MSPLALESKSKLTDRYQTTIPSPVRKALGLSKQDTLRYDLTADGTVLLTKEPNEEADPVMEKFLELLAADIAAGAANVHVLDGGLKRRIEALVGNVEVDLDAPLAAEDE